MKTPVKLAFALALSGSISLPAHADFFGRTDPESSAGFAMMRQNNILLRNGDDVLQRIRDGFQFDEVNSELVRRFERTYAANPAGFERTFNRGNKYLFHIINEVERRGMPTEIALLPMVESAFVATAESPVGAAGLWQFMPATGRQYGLEQTWWYDGRRDVTAATRAALDYLENLYGLFGDWSLALAAYNWGEGNVSRAIERNRARGLPTDFENLRLPNETRQYVPKLLAVRNVLREPGRFGVQMGKLPNQPYFVAVTTSRHMDLDVAARLAGIAQEDLRQLNPGYNRPLLAYKSGRQLLVPAQQIDHFERNLAAHQESLTRWQAVVVQEDETLADLATRYNMSERELKQVNRISSIRAGQPLLVAAGSVQTTTPDDAPQVAQAATQPVRLAMASLTESPAAQFKTAATDKTATPFADIATADAPKPVAASPKTAAAAGTPFADIASATTDTPSASTRQTVAEAVAPAEVSGTSAPRGIATVKPASQMPQARYVVAQGDTLYSIAQRHNMKPDELRALNSLDSNTVRTGQPLKVAAAQPAAIPPVAPSMIATVSAVQAMDDTRPAGNGIIRVSQDAGSQQYVVQTGDTAYSIARKFGVAYRDLARWNDARQLQRLQPGHKVLIVGS
ncbi:LysM peptidoglycan-binding domain-containing protein [Laribacter hongkongensis]|uniref:lytic transglycosylase n=1 Tax=Laribacter hongkongensis TaxID=168471 RepID=UPI001EFD0782|nr:LysM peptidoglycan-binding domain-containing protein [Laribacter hongkongensis]MCG9054111.1 LysM peptidoglycan-binding domain-containing protein [Laribacter hongkongensis]